MLTAVREVQIPLLAVMLLGACTAKMWRALRPRADRGRADGSRLLPGRLQKPVTVVMFTTELLLGLGLLGTAGRFGGQHPGLPATVVRTGTALFFLIAVGALNEMRQRSPDSGCGCFDHVQHCRGICAPEPSGLSEVSPYCQGIAGGTVDPIRTGDGSFDYSSQPFAEQSARRRRPNPPRPDPKSGTGRHGTEGSQEETIDASPPNPVFPLRSSVPSRIFPFVPPCLRAFVPSPSSSNPHPTF